MSSPLYIKTQGMAWDFSNVLGEVQRRGEMGARLAAMEGEASASPSASIPNMKRKGEAAWWIDDDEMLNNARAKMQKLFIQHRDNPSAIVNSPEFESIRNEIAQSTSYATNEFRGQQKERKDKFAESVKERKNELLLANDGRPFILSGQLVTAGQALDIGTTTSLGEHMPWAGFSVADGKGFDESIDKVMANTKYNEEIRGYEIGSIQPGVSEDAIALMSAMVNTMNGRKDNYQQISFAITDAINVVLNGNRSNDVLSLYLQTPEGKAALLPPSDENKSSVLVKNSNGEWEVDMGKLWNQIVGTTYLKDDKGNEVTDPEGNKISVYDGWFPKYLESKARKYRWFSDKDRSASSTGLHPNWNTFFKSQTMNDMMSQWGISAKGYTEHIPQNVTGPDGSRRIEWRENSSAIEVLTDFEKIRKKNAAVGFSEKNKWIPANRIFQGDLVIPGVSRSDGTNIFQLGRLPNGIGEWVEVTEPTNRIAIGADRSIVHDGDRNPIEEGRLVPQAMYHVFDKSGGVRIPKEHMALLGLEALMPKPVGDLESGEVIETLYITPSGEKVWKEKPDPGDEEYMMQVRGRGKFDSSFVLEKQTRTKKRMHSAQNGEGSITMPFANILDDDDLLSTFNTYNSTNIRKETEGDREWVIIPEAMFKMDQSSADYFDFWGGPNNPIGQQARILTKGDPNLLLSTNFDIDGAINGRPSSDFLSTE